MPVSELEASILMLSNLSIDGIRVKPIHRFSKGRFEINPSDYSKHLEIIKKIIKNKEVVTTKITIPKLEKLLNEDTATLPPENCWYRDFNPLVVGSDGINYSCCEMKYDRDFYIGAFDKNKNNFSDAIQNNQKPQKIINNKCFRGCKGYLLNKELQNLLDEYNRKSSKLFSDEFFIENSKHIISSLVRTSLGN